MSASPETMQFQWEEITDTRLMRVAMAELAKLDGYEDDPNEPLYAYPIGKAIEYYYDKFKRNLREASPHAIPHEDSLKKLNQEAAVKFENSYQNDPPAPVDGPPQYDYPGKAVKDHIKGAVIDTVKLMVSGPTSGRRGFSQRDLFAIVSDPKGKEVFAVVPQKAMNGNFEFFGTKAVLRLPA